MSHYIEQACVSRQPSPGVEQAIQDSLRSIFKTLMESKGLYQNVKISEDVFDPFLEGKFTRLAFAKEFRARPILALSANNVQAVLQMAASRDDFALYFLLPLIDLECQSCRQRTTYQSVPISGATGQGLHPPGEDREQIFALTYRCAACSKGFVSFQIRRVGMRFQLTGRSIPFRARISPAWPVEIKEIIGDVHSASAEGDVSAGYYHLRTAIEFHAKAVLGIPADEKIEGQSLCERYNGELDIRMKQGIPSLTPLYAELSLGLHTRKGDVESLDRMINTMLQHFEAKAMFERHPYSA